MRKFLGVVVALIIAFAAYWGWALYGAAQLATVAAAGDAAAVMQRVDLAALRHSLSRQIVRAYLQQNPQFQKMGQLEQGIVGSVGGGVADAMLREILTPDNIAALLQKGHVGAAKESDPTGGAWRMPSLGEAFRAAPWDAVSHSYFDGPISFVVGLNGPEGRYGVHLSLSGTTWRLSGLDIPDEVSAKLAHEIADRQKATE